MIPSFPLKEEDLNRWRQLALDRNWKKVCCSKFRRRGEWRGGRAPLVHTPKSVAGAVTFFV